MTDRTIPVSAERLQDGAIIKTKYGFARVIEVVKNLSADKYRTGYEITYEILKTKIRRTMAVGAKATIEMKYNTTKN